MRVPISGAKMEIFRLERNVPVVKPYYLSNLGKLL